MNSIKNRLLNYKIFTVLFLIFSLAGAVYLVNFSQNYQKGATGNNYSSYDQCRADKGRVYCDNLFNPAKPTDKTLPANNQSACTSQGGIWCSACGGFCSQGTNQTCNQASAAKCGDAGTSGANYGACSSTFNVHCTCSGVNVCFDRGKLDGTQCNTSDGLCAVYENSNKSTASGMYYCKNSPGSTNGVPNSCDTTTGGVVITAIPSCFCGVIQVDTAGQGYKTYTSTCGCSPTKTPSKTPTSTPTKTLTSTPTSTPTSTLTPTQTPTGTVAPSNTPTITVTPTNTPTGTPGPTNTPTPTIYITQGPSPTRIILPSTGVEFPIQALTVTGVIISLFGFLILL